jgi:hypothetical protein
MRGWLSLLLLMLAAAGCVQAPQDALEAASVLQTPPAGAAVMAHRALPAGDDATALDAAAVGLPGAPAVTPRLMPVGASAIEPTLGVTPDGNIFYAALGDSLATLVLRSDDKGATWTDASPMGPMRGGVPPASLDPYVYVDPETGRVFSMDLYLACAWLSFTDDGGDLWVTNPLGCGHPVGAHDHQTIAAGKPTTLATVGYPNVVYYCVNRLVDSACATSLNGGASFGPMVPVWDATKGCGGLHGHVKTAPDGNVYLPKAQCDRFEVARSTDNGLTWDIVRVSDQVRAAEVNDPAVAIDEEGNVYGVWVGADGRLYLAVSTDAGASYGPALDVTPPGVETAQLPAIAAGSAGRIAFAYYGTGTKDGHLGEDGEWDGYLAIVTDALAGAPTVTTMRVNAAGEPMLEGGCSGGRCPGVLDFIDVVIDAEGRPYAAFTDAMHDNAGMLATLADGPALRGEGQLEALP